MGDIQSESAVGSSSPSETPTADVPIINTLSVEPPSDGIMKSSSPERSRESECQPCREVRFAFGPRRQYFIAIQDPEHNAYQYSLNSVVAKSWKTVSIDWPYYTVAIEPDGGLHVAGRTRASEDPSPSWVHCGFAPDMTTSYELVYQRAWQKIADEHATSIESLSNIHFTIGPQGAYICTTNNGYFYRDIPLTLVSRLESCKISPRQVALGQGNAWVALWKDGTLSYNLGANYPGLGESLDNRNLAKERVAFIALNPYDDESWFMVDCDGFCAWHFKSIDDVQGIRDLTLSYMQRSNRRNGLSYTTTRTSNGKTESITITPETTYDQPTKSIPQHAHKFADYLKYRNNLNFQQVMKRRDIVAGCTVGMSTSILCKVNGLRLGSALNLGVAAGAVAFAVVSKNLNE